jgi:tetratricopeptide (TPR) repeat protein
MKKIKLFIFVFFISNLLLAQNKFNEGFEAGYKNGYCLNSTIPGCIPPANPIPPIPGVNESINSYQDGYNRGFERGLSDQKSLNSNGRERYQTSSPQNIDYMYKIDVNDINALSKALYDAKGRAVEQYKVGNYVGCINISKAGLNVSPYDDEFMMLLEGAYKQLNDYKEAIKYLKKAYNINHDPNVKAVIDKLEE